MRSRGGRTRNHSDISRDRYHGRGRLRRARWTSDSGDRIGKLCKRDQRVGKLHERLANYPRERGLSAIDCHFHIAIFSPDSTSLDEASENIDCIISFGWADAGLSDIVGMVTLQHILDFSNRWQRFDWYIHVHVIRSVFRQSALGLLIHLHILVAGFHALVHAVYRKMNLLGLGGLVPRLSYRFGDDVCWTGERCRLCLLLLVRIAVGECNRGRRWRRSWR